MYSTQEFKMEEFYHSMCMFARLPIESSHSVRVSRICELLGAQNAYEAAELNGFILPYQVQRLAQWRDLTQKQTVHVDPLYQYARAKIMPTDPRVEQLERLFLRTGINEQDARAAACVATWCDDDEYVLDTVFKYSKENMRCSPHLRETLIREMMMARNMLNRDWKNV